MREIPKGPCLALIHAFEQGPGGGFAVHRYNDPAGHPTIGWGHLLSGPEDPYWDAVFDQAKADMVALVDLEEAAKDVCDALQGQALDNLNDNQYAALIDFVFNEGAGKFLGSTLYHLVKNGNLTLAPLEFAKWVYGRVNGKMVVLKGLVRRRAAELDVWNAPLNP